MTSFEHFRALAHPGALVPVWRDVLFDMATPVAAFAALRRGPFGFLLESAPAGSETWSRYTFMGTEPRAAWRLLDGETSRWSPHEGWSRPAHPARPLEELRGLVTDFAPASLPELGRFWGGAVGYLSYDAAALLESLPAAPPRVIGAPDALFMVTRVTVIVDNLRSRARVVAAVPVPDSATERDLRRLYDEASADVGTAIARLETATPLRPLAIDPDALPATGLSSYARTDFLRDVEQIREHIRAGDCFQALLARRISTVHDFDTMDLYRALRALNPSPYMYHVSLDGVELVGSSPEALVRVADGRVTLRPIAGTRPRGGTLEEDAVLAANLLADDKERAEHVMLVDLGRNDVGRMAEYGTVEVTSFMEVERFSHVLHLVSQVEGRLPAGGSALDALLAAFPAGTMTGAPKVRAMQIIGALEPERRGPYAGAVGYLAAGDRALDLAITIRTCVIAGGEASVHAGAGIVLDSDPAKEWDETESKARAVLTAIGQVRAAR